MPSMRKDPHSGAIIFDLTTEEQDIRNLKTELEDMKMKLSSKLSELDKVLSSHKKKKN